MSELTQSSLTQSDMIPVSVLEGVVTHLLSHKERDALRAGFVELIQQQFKPEKSALYISGIRGFMAHRGHDLVDILIRDALADTDTEVSLLRLADLPNVLKTVESKSVQIIQSSNPETIDLHVPLMQGSVVGAVFVVEAIEFNSLSQSVWQHLFAAFSHLNHMMYSAEVDHLTGLMNRLAFERLLNKAANDSQRTSSQQKATYFALVDIDFFKKVNDTFGHLYGDEVLILLARLMSDSFRSNDWLFRYGGEEFAIVLHEMSYQEAHDALERFRQKVEQHPFPQVDNITISIGYSRMNQIEAISSLIDRADSALYFSKNHGRNQVHCYEDLVEQGLVIEPEQEVGNIELF